MAVWEEEKWKERPDSINPMLSYAELHNSQEGFAVLSNSSREYEIVGADYDTIALTQFRSVGVLGKPDLLRRPDRPSGIALPGFAIKKEISLSFAIVTHRHDSITGSVHQAAREYLTPLKTYNKIPYDMKLNPDHFHTPTAFLLFEQSDTETVLSVVKKAEKDAGLIVRLFNPSRVQQAYSRIVLNQPVSRCEEVNLHEDFVVTLVPKRVPIR